MCRRTGEGPAIAEQEPVVWTERTPLSPWRPEGEPVMFLVLVMVAAALGTVLAVPLVKCLAFAVGAIDRPVGRRRIHREPIPRLGGVAVFVPALVVVPLALNLLFPGALRLTLEEHLELLLSAGAVFLVGLYDDIRGAKASLKLAVQVGAAVALFCSGISIEEISTPFGVKVPLGILDLPLTLLWVVGLTNAMNLLDGIDGLAAGVGALGALSVAILSASQGWIELSTVAGALCGGLLGFLFYNFHPATIFLGDCGALTLGFLLAEIPLIGSQKAAAAVALLVPITALGIPIFDTTLAVIRRTVRGRHPFQADRAHLHHRLLALGLTQSQVAITLYGVTGILTAMAILMTNASRVGALMILLAMGAGAIVAVRRLGMDEVKTLWGIIRHGERRRRPPRYRSLLVRNSMPLLQRCETRAAFDALLEEIRRALDLDSLRIRFTGGMFPLPLDGATELAFVKPDPHVDRGPAGTDTYRIWSTVIQIYCEMRSLGRATRTGTCEARAACRWENAQCQGGRGRVVGELRASKPAWKRRRASEKDDDLLEMLADGLGRWFARQLRDGHVARPSVLVAHPDESAQRFIRDALQEAYDVVSVADGMKALAEARSHPPFLIFLDPRADRANGFSVCRALKADPRTRQTPIIILAAKDVAETFRAAGNGADGYIKEPYDAEELRAQVREALRTGVAA